MKSVIWATITIGGLLLLWCGVGSAQDNLYCGPGNQAKFGEHDGPASLPLSCFFTAMPATPSPGRKIQVGVGSDLQRAIDQAKCGETLELAAGASFHGAFSFPAKGCDDAHWITVQTAGRIPPEGTRITPCYAGVGSLAGRPAFPCSSPVKAMAALIVPPRGNIKVSDHYRFIGLEITRDPGLVVYNLVLGTNSSKLIFDRVWLHGNSIDDTQRGIGFPGGSFIAVVDSYLSDFHCTAMTGSCVDSQALWAGVGDQAGGTYKIVNNFLEAGGENIMMGGGAGSATPADIEIRRNHFFKPLTWLTNSAPRFVVKNNFELKNGSRVLVEGNVFDNSWGGFSQAGFQILLTPKSQSNHCPQCIVSDVTIRYCVLRHSGAGMQLASAASDSGGLSRGLMNVSIHDLVMGDISEHNYAGNGITFQLSASPGSAMHDISLRHLTVPVSDKILLIVGGEYGGMPRIALKDNILGSGGYQVMSTGGRENCAYQKRDPKDIFNACWRNYDVSGNLLIDSFEEWPAGNRSVSLRSLGISRDVNQLDKLKLSSKRSLHGNARMREDPPGADIDRLKAMVAGVE